MASYQSRRRDPLLDSATQAAIEKRGRELFGLALAIVGLLCAALLGSYSPDDPSWMSATDAPAQNLLGYVGASIAAPVMMIIGLGSFIVPVTLLGWGARFVFHIGQDRALGRLFMIPFAIIAASLFAATLTPVQNWPDTFGMGGLFGDTVLGLILTILPLPVGLSINLLSLLTFAGMLAVGLAATGFIKPELRIALHFLWIGTVLLYAFILRLLGGGVAASASAAQGMTVKLREHRAAALVRRAEQRSEDEFSLVEDDEPKVGQRPNPAVVADAIKARTASVVRAPESYSRPVAAPVAERAAPVAERVVPVETPSEPSAEAGGFLSGLLRRNVTEPTAELSADDESAEAVVAEDNDRVRARIADIIKSRSTPPSPTGVRIEPSLTAGRGPKPLVYNPTPFVEVQDDMGEVDAPEVTDSLPEQEDNDRVMAVPHVPIPRVVIPRPEPEAEAPRAPAPQPRGVVQHPPKRAPQPSRQAKAEAQPALSFDEKYADYLHPPLALLTNPIEIQRLHLSDEALEENARMLESVLDDYGIKGEIVSVRPGPVVTMYELEPAPGLKASRVIGLADDIARSMSALSARVSTVPGRSVIGIELPNENREKVVLREILSHRDFGDGNQKLPLALGKDIGGEPIIANLAKMPHLLIAGTTGSGKSVAINTMILSLLYKLTPEECRMIMIDPKMLELSVYDGIPHLLSPVVTDPKKAVVALKWVVGEMEERYRRMSKMGVRNIDGYNGRVKDALSRGEMFSRTVQTGFDEETGDPIFETEEFAPELLPYIVVIVDEMADLMMVAGKEIEACIQRLAQMARASGIHLIMATQRPSVDVITGTIKANFPTRISFQVTSKIDSRTILGEMGAEQLLGMGDMLYMAGGSRITRVHGPFVSDEEVEEVVNHLKGFGPPEYMSGVVEGPSDEAESKIDMVLGLGGNTDGEDALYDQAVAIVIKDRKCSTSYIQRKLAIGYNKAARLVEQMEDEGVVSAANHVGKREILVPEQA